MRLKSEIWVSAFLRRWQTQGVYGAVVHKGAAEAGAIYVIVNHLDGNFHLFGPAPGPTHNEEGERRWSELAPYPLTQEAVAQRLERAKSFDPDIWIVEIEDRKGTAGLVAAKE
jgi:hypothetical protein